MPGHVYCMHQVQQQALAGLSKPVRVWGSSPYILHRMWLAKLLTRSPEKMADVSDVVNVASSCHKPEPVSASKDRHTDACVGQKFLRSSHLADNSKTQIAPYQALPVAGPVISQDKYTALAIKEPAPDMSDEVRFWTSSGALANASRPGPCQGWPCWAVRPAAANVPWFFTFAGSPG